MLKVNQFRLTFFYLRLFRPFQLHCTDDVLKTENLHVLLHRELCWYISFFISYWIKFSNLLIFLWHGTGSGCHKLPPWLLLVFILKVKMFYLSHQKWLLTPVVIIIHYHITILTFPVTFLLIIMPGYRWNNEHFIL